MDSREVERQVRAKRFQDAKRRDLSGEYTQEGVRAKMDSERGIAEDSGEESAVPVAEDALSLQESPPEDIDWGPFAGEMELPTTSTANSNDAERQPERDPLILPTLPGAGHRETAELGSRSEMSADKPEGIEAGYSTALGIIRPSENVGNTDAPMSGSSEASAAVESTETKKKALAVEGLEPLLPLQREAASDAITNADLVNTLPYATTGAPSNTGRLHNPPLYARHIPAHMDETITVGQASTSVTIDVRGVGSDSEGDMTMSGALDQLRDTQAGGLIFGTMQSGREGHQDGSCRTKLTAENHLKSHGPVMPGAFPSSDSSCSPSPPSQELIHERSRTPSTEGHNSSRATSADSSPGVSFITMALSRFSFKSEDCEGETDEHDRHLAATNAAAVADIFEEMEEHHSSSPSENQPDADGPPETDGAEGEEYETTHSVYRYKRGLLPFKPGIEPIDETEEESSSVEDTATEKETSGSSEETFECTEAKEDNFESTERATFLVADTDSPTEGEGSSFLSAAEKSERQYQKQPERDAQAQHKLEDNVVDDRTKSRKEGSRTAAGEPQKETTVESKELPTVNTRESEEGCQENKRRADVDTDEIPDETGLLDYSGSRNTHPGKVEEQTDKDTAGRSSQSSSPNAAERTERRLRQSHVANLQLVDIVDPTGLIISQRVALEEALGDAGDETEALMLQAHLQLGIAPTEEATLVMCELGKNKAGEQHQDENSGLGSSRTLPRQERAISPPIGRLYCENNEDNDEDQEGDDEDDVAAEDDDDDDDEDILPPAYEKPLEDSCEGQQIDLDIAQLMHRKGQTIPGSAPPPLVLRRRRSSSYQVQPLPAGFNLFGSQRRHADVRRVVSDADSVKSKRLPPDIDDITDQIEKMSRIETQDYRAELPIRALETANMTIDGTSESKTSGSQEEEGEIIEGGFGGRTRIIHTSSRRRRHHRERTETEEQSNVLNDVAPKAEEGSPATRIDSQYDGPRFNNTHGHSLEHLFSLRRSRRSTLSAEQRVGTDDPPPSSAHRHFRDIFSSSGNDPPPRRLPPRPAKDRIPTVTQSSAQHTTAKPAWVPPGLPYVEVKEPLPQSSPTMNNFPSFLDTSGASMSGNIPRQAPSPSQASHPVNGGIGGNGMPLANGLPSGGQTTDMNYLWNVIQTLCDTLAENRAQASNLVNGVAQIQARAAQEGSSPTIAQVNGELSAARAAEIATLQTQISTAHRNLSTLDEQNASLRSLITDYENALTLVLEKLRPYAYQHTQATIALHRHYNEIIERERQTNLELRLEHADWQARLGKAADYARMALREHNDSTLPYISKIQELKQENKVLRRLAGWEPAPDDSDDEEEKKKKAALSGQN